MIGGRYDPLEAVRPGVAFRARDMTTAQTVVIHPIAAPDADTLEACVARGSRIRGVFHPALMTLFDLIPSGDRSFMAVVEFVPARPLRLILAGLPMHPRRAAELASEVADALAEVHAHGFAHGAVSTDSVVLTTKGKAKLSVVEALRVREATEAEDLQALEALYTELSGKPSTGGAQSAAVMAAGLRDLTRVEPSR